MPNVVSIETARARLNQILRKAGEKNERFVVDREGEPEAVIIGIRDFIKTIAPAPAFMNELRAYAKRRGLDRLSRAEIGREVAAARKKRRGPSPGKASVK